MQIRRTLTTIMMVTSFAALAFTSLAFLTYEYFAFRRDMHQQIETIGRIVANNTTAALAFNDPDAAAEVLSGLSREPQIVAAALYDRDGALFATYPEKIAGELPTAPLEAGYEFASGFLTGFEPVTQNGDFRVGTLYLRASAKAIYQRLALYGLIACLVLAASVLIAFLVSRRLEHHISHPFDVILGKLRSQLARLELLNRITRAITERQDPQSIFKVVLHTLEDDMPLDFGCVCLYAPETQSIKVASIGPRSNTLAAAVSLHEGAELEVATNGFGRCLKGTLVYEPDIAGAAKGFTAQLARGGLRSVVISPLLSESTVFGLLVGGRHTPSAFSSGDCEFMRQLSEHVALSSHDSQLYAALQQAYEDLRQSQQAVLQQERLRALGQMASGIAHDINNALSPVALYTESILEREEGLSERTRGYLHTIQRAVEDVAQTVARMREFYRPREPQLVLAEVDLNSLVQQVLDLTRARWGDLAQERGAVIELKCDMEKDLPTIMGAESEIRDALTNLVFNATDAMPDGGTLSVVTRLVTSPLPGEHPLRHALLEVRDTGVGMDEETRRRCLEPFYTTKGERGTGLGLAMVFGMVKRHSADLEIESAVGAGTVARLIFPVPVRAVSGDAAADRRGAYTGPVNRLRLLIVDDDPMLLKSLRDILEADGHQVTSAEGGQKGIDTFIAAKKSGTPFGAVITDLGMPYIDGRKVAATLRGLDGQVPIIMLTGWGQRLIEEESVPPGVSRVLSKPPRLHELRAAFAELA